MKEINKKSKKYWFYYVCLFSLVIGLWIISFWWTIWLDGYPEGSGERGDLFGAINSLFSGLAFAGLIGTILMQGEELSLQRQDLKESTRVAEETLIEQRTANTNIQKQISLGNEELKLKRRELFIQTYSNLLIHHSENHRFLRKEIGTETTFEQKQRNINNAESHLEKSNFFMNYLLGELEDLGVELKELNEIEVRQKK